MDIANHWDGEIGKDFVRVGDQVFDHPHHVEFVTACREANLKPYVYKGRFYYVGPAVTLPSPVDVACLGIEVPLNWDHMGKRYVVHPARSANETAKERVEALLWLYHLESRSQSHQVS